MDDHTQKVEKPWYQSRTVIALLSFYAVFLIKKYAPVPLPPDIDQTVEILLVGFMGMVGIFFRRIAGKGIKVMEWLFGRIRRRIEWVRSALGVM